MDPAKQLRDRARWRAPCMCQERLLPSWLPHGLVVRRRLGRHLKDGWPPLHPMPCR